jgi:hypothetical protein
MKRFQIALSAFFAFTTGLSIISFGWLVLVEQNTDINIDPEAWDQTSNYYIFGFLFAIMIATFCLMVSRLRSLLKKV